MMHGQTKMKSLFVLRWKQNS